MKKPAELRAHLSAWVPELKDNPDKLHLYINRGRIATRLGATPSYEIRYQLQIIVTDYTAATDTLIVPLAIWIAEHQPDLLQNPATKDAAIQFEAEILDHDTVDISITLDLSERVVVTPAGGGGYTCTHLADPALPDLTGPTGWDMEIRHVSIDGTPVAP